MRPGLKLEYAERHDAKHTYVEISKTEELLGYEPTMTIREGVERFTAWYTDS